MVPHMYDKVSSGPPYVLWSPHVKCLHVLYDSYGPPYLIWNRYHMVPYMYIWPPLPYMEQVLYGPLTCMYGPHMWHLHVLHDSYGPPYLIWNRYHMVNPTYMHGPPHVIYD